MISKQLNRFCFSPDYNWIKQYELAFAKTTNNLFLDQLGIETLDLFANEAYPFVIIETAKELSLEALKNRIKKALNKNEQIALIETLIETKNAQPLEKIFKMIPLKDNLVERHQNFNRSVMTLELNADDDMLESYKDVHKPEAMWPEVINNMKTIGVTDMELYLKGYQAFLLMDTHLDFNMETDGEKWANLPREKEWQEYVAKFQKVDPKSNAVEKWKTMTQIGKS